MMLREFQQLIYPVIGTLKEKKNGQKIINLKIPECYYLFLN